jgi:hypothetical protein
MTRLNGATGVSLVPDPWSAPAPGWRRLLSHFGDCDEPAVFFERVADLANTQAGGTFTEIVGDQLLVIEGISDADRLGAISYLATIVRNSPELDPVVVAACSVFEDRELWLPLSEIAYGAEDKHSSPDQARILGCALLNSLFVAGILSKRILDRSDHV